LGDDPACRRCSADGGLAAWKAGCADASLQIERAARKVDHTRDHAKVDVFDDIEHVCGLLRRHSTLGYT